MKDAFDAQEFRHWIYSLHSDQEKYQRLTCQYNLLRFIQRFGYNKTMNKILTFISENDRETFEQLLTNYTNISIRNKLTPNGNEIHPYLNQLYSNGKLDIDVIEILLRRQILYLWKGNDPSHLQLLLPMCHVLIKWDHQISNNPNCLPTVTFNGQTFNPLELIQYDDFPSLDQFANFNQKKRKRFVLRCVDLALGADNGIDWDRIDPDYQLCFCLFKLWWNTQMKHSNSSKMILLALIISFLKHTLLDTYEEINGKYFYININKNKHFFFRKITNR